MGKENLSNNLSGESIGNGHVRKKVENNYTYRVTTEQKIARGVILAIIVSSFVLRNQISHSSNDLHKTLNNKILNTDHIISKPIQEHYPKKDTIDQINEK